VGVKDLDRPAGWEKLGMRETVFTKVNSKNQIFQSLVFLQIGTHR
jgi:hypothetical protein